MQPKILLVEDDQFLRELYAETLRNEGYELETAEDGQSAFEKIKQGGWDLVLLDIILPKMDGLEVMRKIKGEGNKPNTKKLIFLTNLDSDQQIKEALTLGDGYLIKSQITPGDFLKEVKQFLTA